MVGAFESYVFGFRPHVGKEICVSVVRIMALTIDRSRYSEVRSLFVAVVTILLGMSTVVTTTLAEPQAEKSNHKRPVVGLVLEGGGALGFAHVGVLKVLEEARIPVHVVAGTSMGSIVGAAFASGRTVPEIEEVITSTDWDKLFNEALPRKLVDYRMKYGRDGEVFGDAKIGIQDGDIVVPVAMVEGQQIIPLFQQLFDKTSSTGSFDDLPVRYRAVAADIETGEAVVLDRGSLALAARASMSVPGFFSPVKIDNRLLVDGGITNNFPVDVARTMNPDILIGVEFDFVPRKRDALTNPLAISAQILDLLLERTSARTRAMMRPEDIMIHPDVKNYTSTSFKNAKEILKAGEDAARAALPRLRALAIPKREYAAYEAKRTSGPVYSPIIDYVRIADVPAHRERVILKALDIKPGETYDRKYVQSRLEAIHQTGIYRSITAELEERDGKHGLVVKAPEKEWLENYVKVGFALEDDFDGSSSYALAADFRMRNLNQAGAYWDNQFEIGRTTRLFTEFYQPLYEGSSFFVAPEGTLSRQDLAVSQDGNNVGKYTRESAVLGLKAGISLGRYGEISSGWRRGPGRLEREIGDDTLPEYNYAVGEYFTRFVLDQLDDPDFPTSGYRLALDGTASRQGAGADSDFEQSRALASYPVTFNNTTLLLNGEGGYSSDGLPVERSYSLGGFFDVSGFAKRSLVADNYWVARTALYHRFAKGSSSLLKFGGFYGATVEYSSLRTEIQSIGDYPSIVSGSVFIAADTPFLPLYLGIGTNNESETSIYIALGRLGSRR